MKKKLIVGDLEVPTHFIQIVTFHIGPVPVRFQLVAPEEQGKKLETELRRLESEKAIKFYAQGGLHDDELEGLCNLVGLQVEKDTSKAPAMYQISGGLELVS